MNKKILGNLLFNLVISSAFVALNLWALENNLEETFISFALLYGFIVIAFNAFYILFCCKK